MASPQGSVSTKLIWGLCGAVVVLLLVVVGLLAFMAGQRSRTPEAGPQVVGTPPPSAPDAAPPISPEPVIEDTEPAPQDTEPVDSDRPSLDPFPQTYDELEANPRAMDAAEAIVDGSEGSLKLENYGKHDNTGWVAQYERESGHYFLLGCSDGWSEEGFVTGYETLLRETPAGFEYITAGQDTPGVDDMRKAGITPDEYRQHILPLYGEWPWGTDGQVQEWR